MPQQPRVKGQGSYSFGYLAVIILNQVLRPVLAERHPRLLDHENQRPPDVSQLLITIGTWLQATGATLCVVFLLGLVTLAGARGSLAAQVVLLGAAVLVALVLLEGVFTLTWVTAAAAGTPASARAGYDLMSRFIQVFPLVPAPAIYLPLGWILLRSPLLPSWLGRVALGLGAAFVLVGFAEVFLPITQAFAAGLAALQDLWILTAAAY